MNIEISSPLLNNVLLLNPEVKYENISQITVQINQIMTDIQNDSSIIKKLLQIILKTKIDKSFQTLASIAISILNQPILKGHLRFNFSGLDFSYISIPYADLSQNYFVKTNFKSSNLQGVSFINSYCQSANFSKANLNQTHFGLIVLPTKSIKCFQLDQDSDNFIVGTQNSIQIYDFNTMRLLKSFKQKSPLNIKLAYLANLLVYSNQLGLTIFNWKSGLIINRITNPGNQAIQSLCFNSSGINIIVGCKDKNIRIFDIYGGKEIKTIQATNDSIYSIKYLKKYNAIVAGSGDGVIRFWDYETGEHLKNLRGHSKTVIIFQVTRNQQKLISGSYDNKIRIWDIASAECLKIYEGHRSQIYALVLVNDRFISAAKDNTIKVWSIQNGFLKTFCKNQSTSSLLYSYKNKRLINLDLENKLIIRNFDIENLKIQDVHDNGVSAILISKNKKFIISASYDKTIKIWETDTGKIIKSTLAHSRSILSLCFSTNQQYIFSSSADATIQMRQTITLNKIKVFKGHKGSIYSIAYSPTKNYLASVSIDNRLKFWNVELGENVKTFYFPNSSLYSICYSPDGANIAVGSIDYDIKIIDSETGQIIKPLQGLKREVSSISYSTDGKLIVAGSKDDCIFVWSTQTGQKINKIESGSSIMKCIISPCNTKIIGSSYNKLLRIWDITSGVCLKQIQNIKSQIISIAYQDNKIYTGLIDSNIYVWDATIRIKSQSLINEQDSKKQSMNIQQDQYDDQQEGQGSQKQKQKQEEADSQKQNQNIIKIVNADQLLQKRQPYQLIRSISPLQLNLSNANSTKINAEDLVKQIFLIKR